MSSVPLFANRRIRIKPGICKLIKRTLKGPGKITAVKNTELAPHDIIGHYQLTAGFTKINFAKELNVSPAQASKYLKKSVGQTIYKGELLAFKKGFLGTSKMIAPTDSIFESLDAKTGEATFRMIPKDVALTSGVFGVVADINQARGEVMIKCMMTEMYGIYGTGNEKEGFVNVISGPSDLVNSSKINDSHRGQILVAGSLVVDDTLKKALGHNASGMVCGGLNMEDYLAMAVSLNRFRQVGTEIGISVIGTEGFGLIPMGDDFYDLLKKHHSKFAMINGNLGRLLLPSDDANSILSCRKVEFPTVEALGVRPEITVSEVKIGDRVRLIWSPFMAAQGKVVAIDGSPTVLNSGISTYLVTVETRTKKIKVPFSNIEIIT